MPLAATRPFPGESKHSEQMIGIWTQTLSEANTPYNCYTAEVFLCSYVLSLILFKCNNAHSLSNI